MIKNIVSKLIFYIFIFTMVIWYWNDSDESTKNGLFYFVFTFAFFQNAYFSYKTFKHKQKDSP